MTVKSAVDLMVLLLYANKGGEIRGITKLEKLIYLLLKEGDFEDYPDILGEYSYKPYDFGPYSEGVYDNIEALKSMNMIGVREDKFENFREVVDGMIYRYNEDEEYLPEQKIVEIYKLNERGRKVAEHLEKTLTPDERGNIEDIKVKYNKMSLKELLHYVYTKYPESTAKSKIVNRILGFGRRPELKPFKREE